MGSEASETLPVVRCPGCEEPMQPKGAAPVTRELDDISYACPKCGVFQHPCHRTAATKFEDDISVARMILVGPLPRPSGPGWQDPLRPGPLCMLNPERFRLE